MLMVPQQMPQWPSSLRTLMAKHSSQKASVDSQALIGQDNSKVRDKLKTQRSLSPDSSAAHVEFEARSIVPNCAERRSQALGHRDKSESSKRHRGLGFPLSRDPSRAKTETYGTNLCCEAAR